MVDLKKCSIEECTNPHRARGWCDNHYKRWKKHGDPRIMGTRLGKYVTDTPGYAGAHLRVKKLRGKATAYLCPCGSQAQEWAYDHEDSQALTAIARGFTVFYSADPMHYQAMCIPCHRTMDLNRT